MKPLYGSVVVVLYALLGACANPFLQPSPRASVGDFTDHVLESLALRLADEKISEAGSAMKLEHLPKAPVQAVVDLLDDIPWVGKLLSVRNVSQKARLEEDLAWLETRRIPLKRELLDLFVARTTSEGDVFSVCVEGVERRYHALDITRFTRLPDGIGPCELTQLNSLKRTQSPLRYLF